MLACSVSVVYPEFNTSSAGAVLLCLQVPATCLLTLLLRCQNRLHMCVSSPAGYLWDTLRSEAG
jgi:hypothetical protein